MTAYLVVLAMAVVGIGGGFAGLAWGWRQGMVDQEIKRAMATHGGYIRSGNRIYPLNREDVRITVSGEPAGRLSGRYEIGASRGLVGFAFSLHFTQK